MFITSPGQMSTINRNINDMNLRPAHHNHEMREDRQKLECQITEQLLPNSHIFPPRPTDRPKLPPHITICPPDEHDVIGSHFILDDEFDNDVFQSPKTRESPSETLYSDDKHKVHSGRLYLICNTGNSSILSSPTRSPSTSPTHSSHTAFPFRVSPPPSAQQWPSTSSSPCSSPSTSPSAKVSVFVRVYRCNSDHFAVITRDSVYTSKPVYVNMRHSRVIPGDRLGRFIVVGHCDFGNTIEFEVPELSSLEQWLDAFQVNTPAGSPNRSFGGSGGNVGGSSSNTSPVPRSPVLPTLAETDEED